MAPSLTLLGRWTYTAGDVMDRHGYFSGKHEGQDVGWSVAAGQTFESKSGLTAPGELPIEVVQAAGFPHIISELGYSQPNAYRADGPLFCAAYGALQGIDGLYFFAVGANTLLDSGINKYQVSSPTMAGTFSCRCPDVPPGGYH